MEYLYDGNISTVGASHSYYLVQTKFITLYTKSKNIRVQGLETLLHLPLVRKLVKRPVMPIFNLLIMPLHVIRHVLHLSPLFVVVWRLLARGHSWMRLVRGNVWGVVDLRTLRVMGSFMSRGGVGLLRRSLLPWTFPRFRRWA